MLSGIGWSEPITSALIHAARQACDGRNAGHDFGHVERVTRLASRLADNESCNRTVLLASAVLHELVNHPKHHERSPLSGHDCAIAASDLLISLGIDETTAHSVASCISQHGWSAGKVPTTPEAALLQDADRLDALGAIGLARCIATGVEMEAALFHPEDPFAVARQLDDRRYSLDHLARKLFRLPDTFHSAAARELAKPRIAFLRCYVEQIAHELFLEAPAATMWDGPTSPPSE